MLLELASVRSVPVVAVADSGKDLSDGELDELILAVPEVVEPGAGRCWPLFEAVSAGLVSARVRGISRDDIITVPRSAVRGGNQLLFINDDSRLDIRTVNVLRSDASNAYITGGARPGERITLTTIEAPVNGMKVRVNGEQEEAPPVDEKSGDGDQLATSAD